MENRHGLCADFAIHNPITESEPAMALRQPDAQAELPGGVTPTTLGADQGYHRKDAISGCRERAIAPERVWVSPGGSARRASPVYPATSSARSDRRPDAGCVPGTPVHWASLRRKRDRESPNDAWQNVAD